MIIAMLREAVAAMMANRLRSFLTMLGMIIGVSSVILMLAIGSGVQQKVQDQISSMGSNLLIVQPGSMSPSGVRMGFGNAPTLVADDATAIRDINGVAASAPVGTTSAQVIYGTNNWSTQITGTTTDYLTLRDWNIVRGYVFDEAEQRNGANVALIGKVIAENLFGDEDPINKTIRIKGSPFVVIGILGSKGQSFDGRDQDDTIIIPITTLQRKISSSRFRNAVRMIMVSTESADVMTGIQEKMSVLLRERHKLSKDAPDDFNIQNMTAMAESAAETTKVMRFMLGAIAGISLLVGGIGIMNIMLVSVTERTREIGIRMAIGARQSSIRLQFLLEAVIISFIGCLIGVSLGVLGAWAVATLADMLVVVTISSILLSFSVATGIGIFFGYYPANKAAKLKPIEALRTQ